MSSLFKSLRIHQIFGANTDVGKTILTTALVRASALSNVPVHYLKPVSTGPMQDADDRLSATVTYPRVCHLDQLLRHVKRFAPNDRDISAHCLFRYDEPVSPHLAARLSDRQV